MEYPLSEIIDRLSILALKAVRLPYDKKIEEEQQRFIDAANEFEVPWYDWYAEQRDINAQIWDLEAAIRQGKEGELGLEEVGRRAIKLRDLNKERIRRKNKIAKIMGEFEEIKIDHASSED